MPLRGSPLSVAMTSASVPRALAERWVRYVLRCGKGADDVQHVAQLAHQCGDRAAFERRLVDERSGLVEERAFWSALVKDTFLHVEAVGHELRDGELKGSVGQAFGNRSTNRLLVDVGGYRARMPRRRLRRDHAACPRRQIGRPCVATTG